MLAGAFPEFDVETITITDLLKARPDILILNFFHTLITYRASAFSGRGQFRRSFIATPYLFRQVKRLIGSKLSARRHDYAFSFQLQSLYDASVEGLPHFVYTDHTHLANLEYDQFDLSTTHVPEWIALERQIYMSSLMVFTRSSNITNSLIEQYDCPSDKVACVYVGVNVPASEKNSGQEKYASKNILFVGLDWERKGGPDLLEAFQQVLKAHPDAHLTIIGPKPSVHVPNCTILGKLPLDALLPYYESASIFCLPTKLEPFGVVFVEAMSHRLPIVATDIGAIPDFVTNGKNGYLVSPGDTAGLAHVLVKLLDDPEQLEQFGDHSYKLYKQRYNWKQVGRLVRMWVSARLQLPDRVVSSDLNVVQPQETL